MRLTPLARIALFPLVVALGTGCFYGPHHFFGQPGNIFVSWTFSGATCAQTPAVAQVTVNVLNSAPIQPNTFACQVGSPPNQLVIYNFNPGTYVLTLSGLDASGAIIWTGSATVVVDGDVSGTVDLRPVAPSGPSSIANLSWGFAPAVGSFFPPCTATGDADPDRIDSVALYVDGSNNPAQTYGCSQGLGTSQVSTPSLAPGSHSLQLVAYQAGLSYPFAQSAPVSVNFVANTPATQAFTFDWLVGGNWRRLDVPQRQCLRRNRFLGECHLRRRLQHVLLLRDGRGALQAAAGHHQRDVPPHGRRARSRCAAPGCVLRHIAGRPHPARNVLRRHDRHRGDGAAELNWHTSW